ncbi:MAG: T9SS type A sorting domain-containing protein [Prevotella sp.]|nr:T9SS type A sorting domain-containing protein [Prevotella sp.]
MMKQRMTLWMIGMLLSLLPSVASSPDSLEFRRLSPDSEAYINTPIVILIQVTNTAQEDYYGWWCVGDTPDWKNSQAVEIKAGETVELAFETTISQPGDVRLHVFDLMTEEYLYGFYIYFNIVEPKVEATIEVNTEQDDEGNRFIYSDYSSVRIGGSFTLTNLGESTLINKPTGAWGAYHDLFQVVLIPQIEEQNYNTIYGMANEIKAGETCSRYYGFTISAKPVEGQEYTVQLMYSDHVLATSEPFTIRRSTNTYWTADLSRKPLPVVGDVLKVPGDALAVDMRGLYDLSTVYSIDVSEANPNCLYYLGFLDYVPKGFDSEANIIRNGEASLVTIDSNYDFYCPENFKAKTALFTYTPISESMGPASPVMSQRMSGMITLPFGAQKAWLSGTNEYHEDSPWYNEDFKIAYLFDVKSDGTLVFRPYPSTTSIIYWDFPILIYDIKPSPVVFYSEDVDIWSGISRGTIAEGEIFEYGSMTTRKAEKYSYSWNCDKNCFCLNEEGAMIRPFNVTISKWSLQSQTCIDAGWEVYPHEILFINPEETGIVSISNLEGNSSQELTVYSLNGQPVGTATYANGQIKAEGLKPGLYVAGGRKIFIK